MEHYNYERNITEIKKEFESILINTLYPSLYKGLYTIYYTSKNNFLEMHKQAQKNPGIKLLKLITTFRQYLKNIEHLPKSKLERETNRIKATCGKSDYLDELIMACLKSHIVLLSYSYSNKRCKLIKERLHKTVDSTTFIHKCYIECANIFINHAELFYDCELSKESNIILNDNDILINRRYIYELIRVAIKNAIRNSIPLKRICEEYLEKDYPDDEKHNEYNRHNFGDSLKRSLGSELYTGDIINDSAEFEEDTDNKEDYTNELVFNRKKDFETSANASDERVDVENNRNTETQEKKNTENKISDSIEIKNSTETKEITIANVGKGDVTLKDAIEEYKKSKQAKNPEIDIVRV